MTDTLLSVGESARELEVVMLRNHVLDHLMALLRLTHVLVPLLAGVNGDFLDAGMIPGLGAACQCKPSIRTCDD